MGSAITKFKSIVSAEAVGAAELERLAAGFGKAEAAAQSFGTKAEKLNEHPGFGEFATKVKEGIEHPLQAAGEAAKAALETMGPLGTGIAAAVGVLATASTVAFEAAHALGEYGTQIQNVALRTGLTTREVGQFSFAARAAGQDVGIFETAMRRLSQGLGDTSEDGKKARAGLAELGVSVYEASGKVRPMGEVFLQISEGLNRIEDPTRRNAEALKIFGRAGIELIPTMRALAENVERARELGFGPSDEDVARWEGYHKQIVEAEMQWERFKRKVEEPLAATFGVIFNAVTGDFGDVIGGAARTLQGQIGKVALPQIEKRFQVLQESGMLTPPEIKAIHEAIQRERDKQTVSGAGSLGLSVSLPSFASALAPANSDAQLEEARRKLGELQRDLSTKIDLKAPYETQAELAGQIEKQKAVVSGLEARAKATKSLQEAEKSLDAFEKEMDQRAMDPVSKIFARRDELVGHGANAGRATDAALRGAASAVKGIDVFGGAFTLSTLLFGGDAGAGVNAATAALPFAKGSEQLKADFEMALKAGKSAADEWDGVYKTLDKVGNENVRVFLDAVRAGEQAGREIEDIRLRSGREEIVARSNRALRMTDLALGPGHEAEATVAAYATRLALAQQLYDLDMERAAKEKDTAKAAVDRARAEAELRRESLDAQIEAEMRIAELQAQRLEQWRQFSVEGVNAVLSGNVGGFARQQAMGLFDRVIGNAAGMVWSDVSKVIPHAGAGTFLGNLLAGSQFGPDPGKVATDANTLATIDNTMALRAMALSASGGGGGAVSPGTFARIVADGGFGGGGSAAVDTGYTADGLQKYSPENYGDDGSYLGRATGRDYSVGQISSTMPRSTPMWARGVGVGTAVAGGAFGMWNGLSHGGAQGDLQAAASFTGMMGAALPLISQSLSVAGPIGMGLAVGLGLVSSLLGDSRRRREDQEQDTLTRSRYIAPTATTYTVDRYGRGYDSDVAGNMRPIIQVNIPVQALDARDLADRAPHLADTVAAALEGRVSPRLETALRNTAFTR